MLGSLEDREKALEELSRDISGKVLDVATGSGYLARYLVRNASRVFCLDVDPEKLRRTKKELASDLYFVCGDARRLPFKDSSFDAVVSWSALVHVEEWKAALGEMFRVSDGCVVASEPYGDFAVRAMRDFRCRHKAPCSEEISVEFEKYGETELARQGFIDIFQGVKIA